MCSWLHPLKGWSLLESRGGSVSIVRGGTSRGVFTTAERLSAFVNRDDVVRRLLGSPDPYQVDGLGGTHAVSSKFCVVGPSAREDVDIDYQVAQVGVGDNVVDWSGTCGNLTSAVGPYALTEGIIEMPRDATHAQLTLRNLSTNGLIKVGFSVKEGRYQPLGTTRICGIDGAGSRIDTAYLDPVGGTLGKLYPTGQAVDRFSMEHRDVDASIVDVSHPYMFVSGEELGVPANADYASLRMDQALQHAIEGLRLEGSRRVGATEAQRSSVPRIVLCYRDTHHGLRALAFSGGRFIPALPVTAGLALSAACRLQGSVVQRLANTKSETELTVAHPTGTVDVSMDVGSDGRVRSVGLVRTARVLMSGVASL